MTNLTHAVSQCGMNYALVSTVHTTDIVKKNNIYNKNNNNNVKQAEMITLNI